MRSFRSSLLVVSAKQLGSLVIRKRAGTTVEETGAVRPCGATISTPDSEDQLLWQGAGDLQHIYATKEFERQVYARLTSKTDEPPKRITSYTTASPIPPGAENDFLQQFPNPSGFNWARKEAKLKGAAPGHDSAAKTVIECDLYLRHMNLLVADLFKECMTEVWDTVRTTAACPVLLCEVAETPASMRAKLYQLCRAMKYGPRDLHRPSACVICLNGELPLFQTAADAITKALATRPVFKDVSVPQDVPVFAIWTAYRNTYAEIKALHSKMDDKFKGVDDNFKTVFAQLDELKTVPAQLDELKKFKGVDDNFKTVFAQLDELKTVSAQLDELKTMVVELQKQP